MKSRFEELAELFFEQYEDNVYTHDDIEMEESMYKILDRSMHYLDKWTLDREVAIVKKNPENLMEELEKVKSQEWYKQMKKMHDELLFLRYEIARIYKLKNMRTKELLTLRAELAEIKLKNKTA